MANIRCAKLYKYWNRHVNRRISCSRRQLGVVMGRTSFSSAPTALKMSASLPDSHPSAFAQHVRCELVGIGTFRSGRTLRRTDMKDRIAATSEDN